MIGKSSRQYIIELDDETYLYRHGQFSQIENTAEVDGESWVLTDFPSATQSTISRVATVETEAKYASIMIAKKLQEEGEFTEPVQVVSHVSRKRGRHDTVVFYTALTLDLFHQYQDLSRNSSDALLVFPVHKILLQICRKISGQQPVALVFRHGRYADLLIASQKTVYSASRATCFDQSEEQIQTLWDVIGDDIDRVGREKKLSLRQCVVCNWFDATDKPDWPERPGIDIVETPSTQVTIDGESRSCSLLPMLDILSAGDSISPASDKISCFLKRWLPLAQIVLVVLAAGLWAGATLLQAKTASLEEEIMLAKHQLGELTSYSLDKKVDYAESLDLLKRLDRYRVSKSFRSVINDLSAAVSNQMLIEQVKVDVQNDAMNVQIRGTVHADFQTAYHDYQKLIQFIQRNNYEVVENSFNTEIDQAEFLLVYKSPVGGTE